MDVSLTSAVVILLLVIDPLDNIPLFVSLLKNIDPRRRTVIVIRECVIAYAVLVVFVFFGDTLAGEPFIVPLTIPAISGPTAIATVILMASRLPERMADWIIALERLMGLLLTAIAVEILLRGIEAFVRQIQAG